MEAWESWTPQRVCCAVVRLREACPPVHLPALSLTTYGRQENWPRGHESVRTGPVPHLQHSGEQAHNSSGQQSRDGWSWLWGLQVSLPEVTRAGELPLPLLVVALDDLARAGIESLVCGDGELPG